TASLEVPSGEEALRTKVHQGRCSRAFSRARLDHGPSGRVAGTVSRRRLSIRTGETHAISFEPGTHGFGGRPGGRTQGGPREGARGGPREGARGGPESGTGRCRPGP